MTTHAATHVGMLACEQNGHRWAWRTTWHAIGFWECTSCGETKPTGPKTDSPFSAPAAAADTDAKAEPREPKAWGLTKAERQARDAEVVRRVRANEERQAIARDLGISASRVTQIASAAGLGEGFRHALNTERDEQIRAQVAEGKKSIEAIAAEFGVSAGRIYQIAPRGQGSRQ